MEEAAHNKDKQSDIVPKPPMISVEQLPSEVTQFVQTVLVEPQTPQEMVDLSEKIIHLNIQDVRWRLKARQYLSWFFGALLVVQNVVLFVLVFLAYGQGRLEGLQSILSLLVTATLAETYFIIRIIVKELFRDINYRKIHSSYQEK